MFNSNFQLISISVLIISCIYLFYVNFVNIRELNNISTELNHIKINYSTLLNQLKSTKETTELLCAKLLSKDENNCLNTKIEETPNQELSKEFDNEDIEDLTDLNDLDLNELNHLNDEYREEDREEEREESREEDREESREKENIENLSCDDHPFILKRMDGVSDTLDDDIPISEDNADTQQNNLDAKSQNTLDLFFSKGKNSQDSNNGNDENNENAENDATGLDLDIELESLNVESNSDNNVESSNKDLEIDLDVDLDLDINELNQSTINDEQSPVDNTDLPFDKSKINESTVKELKIMCKNLNLSTRGNKTELINRINSHLT